MKNPYDRLSRAISYALHPLIVPTIAALLLLFGPTVMSNLPAEARWFIAAVILLNTLILPAFSLAVMKLFGGLSDLRLQNQRQRMLPMGIVAVCYMLCILSFRQMTVAFLVDRFLIAALCCVVIAFVVNLYWKISLHMTAAGGLLGMMIVMNYTGAVSDCAHRPDRSDGRARQRPPATGQPQSRSGRGRCGGRRSRHGGHRAADLTQALLPGRSVRNAWFFKPYSLFLTET